VLFHRGLKRNTNSTKDTKNSILRVLVLHNSGAYLGAILGRRVLAVRKYRASLRPLVVGARAPNDIETSLRALRALRVAFCFRGSGEAHRVASSPPVVETPTPNDIELLFVPFVPFVLPSARVVSSGTKTQHEEHEGHEELTCTRRCSTCSASITKKLTYHFNGRNVRLTGIYGTLIRHEPTAAGAAAE